MIPYFLITLTLIIFSILVVLYAKIKGRIVLKRDRGNPLKVGADFTILE